jgi:alcohol dehydrogenase (cytochrome c)
MAAIRSIGIFALLLVLFFSGSAAPESAYAARPVAKGTTVDWPHFGNTTDQTRFSTLTQIDKHNVQELGIAWTFSQGAHLSEWETDPVVVHGVMYITTNTSEVVALDAASGRVLWRFTPQVDFIRLLQGASFAPVNRGVEVANGHVYLVAYGAQLFALDARSGHVQWHTRVAPGNSAYTESSPATYWHGLLFVGSAAGDSGLRGFVAAFRASDGREVWRFYTVPEPGHGWMPAAGQHGGGAVWMPPTIDSQSGILYFGTGNPSPDFINTGRPGCNPWTDAIVALNAVTGKFLWARTQVCPDLWDYDSDQTPVLFWLSSHGKQLRAVGAGNKSGYYGRHRCGDCPDQMANCRAEAHDWRRFGHHDRPGSERIGRWPPLRIRREQRA